MRTDAGFTLLETIVALAILGLLSLALVSALRLGGRAWDHNYQRLDDWRQIRAVQDLLRRSLTQAYPAHPQEDDRIAFLGSAESLTIVTPMPAHLALGAYDLLRIRKVRNDLVVEWDRFNPETPSMDFGADNRKVVLIEKVGDVRFSYFGSDRPGVKPDWSWEWRDRRALPSLVKLEIGFPDDSRRIWPELVVRTMIDGQAVPR